MIDSPNTVPAQQDFFKNLSARLGTDQKSVHTGIFYQYRCYLSTPVLSKIIKLSTCNEESLSTFRLQASSRSQALISLPNNHSASQGLATINKLLALPRRFNKVRRRLLISRIKFPCSVLCRYHRIQDMVNTAHWKDFDVIFFAGNFY